MYRPDFKIDRRKVPILSKAEIDIISEQFAFEFMPQILKRPQAFNIDGFVEIYLKLQLDFQYLSHDGRYLGMIVFNDTDNVIVYIPEIDKADYIHSKPGTVIIDNSLINENQEHRYRFTMGHEAGHWIFHRLYYSYDPNQMTLFEMNAPFLQCREINRNYLYSTTKTWDEARWMEWQADKFAAGLLMPRTAVHLLMKEATAFRNEYFDEYHITRLISDIFNVSKQAAYFRLCDLGYIRRPADEDDYKQLSFL